ECQLSLEHGWSTIQKECLKFQADYERIERHHQSGIPHTEHFLSMYADERSTKHFTHPRQVDGGGINKTPDSSQPIPNNKRPMGRKEGSKGEGEEWRRAGTIQGHARKDGLYGKRERNKPEGGEMEQDSHDSAGKVNVGARNEDHVLRCQRLGARCED
ncbi:hypothetical protein EJB05_13443, partial [Eragrostis curvula]